MLSGTKFICAVQFNAQWCTLQFFYILNISKNVTISPTKALLEGITQNLAEWPQCPTWATHTVHIWASHPRFAGGGKPPALEPLQRTAFKCKQIFMESISLSWEYRIPTNQSCCSSGEDPGGAGVCWRVSGPASTPPAALVWRSLFFVAHVEQPSISDLSPR